MGNPSDALCTRSWCVRPVSGVSSSQAVRGVNSPETPSVTWSSALASGQRLRGRAWDACAAAVHHNRVDYCADSRTSTERTTTSLPGKSPLGCAGELTVSVSPSMRICRT